MPDFSPLPLLSGPMAQSFLASYKSKTDVRLGVPKDSVWKLIRTPEQVSLLSLWNECPNPKGYILMIHGWEGSHLSSYMVRTKQFFLREGYSIIRLNLRDHGETHHLNEGLFNGSLLQETYSAVYEISKMIPKGMPLFLLGFSLGGNFVLRIAKSHSESPKQKQIQNLKHSFSISPALDPLAATIKMDTHPFLRSYFLKSWSASLQKKANRFPHLYSFGQLTSFTTVMDLTKEMVLGYSEFKSVEDYFLTYTLDSKFFRKIKTPVTILTSSDDPVIPVSDFYQVPILPFLEVIVEKKGGHCGFIETWDRKSYFMRLMKRKLS